MANIDFDFGLILDLRAKDQKLTVSVSVTDIEFRSKILN